MIREHFSQCSGCTACAAICPENAIIMQPDAEGFLFPIIDKEKCISCDLCSSVCQIENSLKNPFQDVCYAVQNADSDALFTSSSGAVFPLLANYALQIGGFVCGCVMDNDFRVHHILANDKASVQRMCKSKYVQSDMGGCLREVKSLLDAGKFVLFTGTPCQVGGLRNYLGMKYHNLLTMDVVCHGVPSPQVWAWYVREALQQYAITKIFFRDKTYGWHKSVRMTYKDKNDYAFYSRWHPYDLYMKAFAQNISLRQCCANCLYATPARCSDVTVGDFWTIGPVLPCLDDNRGCSAVMCNTAKGHQIILENQQKCRIFQRITFENIRYCGPLTASSRQNSRRRTFFHSFADNETFMKKLQNELMPVGILNFQAAENYGSLLVGYALFSTIRKLGYGAELLGLYSHMRDSKLAAFRKKHLRISEQVFTYEQCELLNRNYNVLITGSDVIWSDFYVPGEIGMLAWAHGAKTLIAYAASFGEDYWAGNITSDAVRSMLQRFDAISVREASGVALCKSIGVESHHLVDASMLLPVEEYEQLIAEAENLDVPQHPYAASYFVIQKPQKSTLIQHGTFRGLPIIELLADSRGKKYSLEQFLSYIRNAAVVITDSFHAVVFSILWNKPFYVFANGRNTGRIPSLLKMFGIKKSLHDIFTCTEEDLLAEQTVDWASVNKKVCTCREQGVAFLKESLAIPPQDKPEFISSLVKKHGLTERKNRDKLFAWADSVPFDPSLKTPDKTSFRIAAQHALTHVPGPAVHGEEASIQEWRDLSYTLLLAEAHRILLPETFALVAADPEYPPNPKALNDLILQTIRDRHLRYLLSEAERLKGQPVYFWGCGIMYKVKRDLFSGCKPQAILVDWGETGCTVDGLPVVQPSDILPNAEPIPIIIFSERSSAVVRTIHHLYPHFTDIVACARF